MTRKKGKGKPFLDRRGFLFLADIEESTSPQNLRITVIDQRAPQPGIIGKYLLREALRKFGR